MQRQHLAALTLAAAAVAATVIVLAGQDPGHGTARPPRSATRATGIHRTARTTADPTGGPLYAASGGVVWSFTPGHLGQVARSVDSGRTWQVLLPGSGSHTGLSLAAGFFLGPDRGWVVHTYQRGAYASDRRQFVTVLGTSDGGAGWWTSAPLPGTGTGCCSSLSYQVGFTDASHGWLYGMQWEVQGEEVWQVAEQLWQTSDGGRTWTVVPGRLPLQGAIDNADETCPNEPPFAVVFANQQDGWLTASSCSAIGSGPQIWRTTDGGATWTATALPTPGAGWPSATSQPSGVVVGSPWIVGTDLLVAVSGPSGLIVEASADGGQTWQVAGPAVPGTGQYAKPGGFQPVSGADWFVSVPGAVVQTTDAGQTWHTVSTPTLLPGGPISFSAPDQGYAWLRTGVVAATSDGGRTWRAGTAPP